MAALCEAARGYSVTRGPLDMALFRYEAALLAQALAEAPQPLILLSAEDLCGHMPGRKDVMGYGAAPALMAALADVLQEVLMPEEITIYLSTRAPEAWLDSTWGQNLRATRLVLDRSEYTARFAQAANLNGAVAEITAAVQPHAVHHARLEPDTDRPDLPLLDLARLPARALARIVPAARGNPAPPPEILDHLLALNRGDLEMPALKAAKRTLLAEAGFA
jgi:hypothetical protein